MKVDATVLEEKETNGLGRLVFFHPPGTFALTPASQILIEAIVHHQDKLHGAGLDWGSGVGCLAVLASRIGAVNRVIGLEISEDNVRAAIRNAEVNGVSDKVRFILSDSYAPFRVEDKKTLEALKGKVDFIVSNPPSSGWDDGFGFRRIVMSGASEYLKRGGLVFLNISFQYGRSRTDALVRQSYNFSYRGVASSTDWVPFDLGRRDLLDCLLLYARVESEGGADYTFMESRGDSDHMINARTALMNYRERGESPLTKWQTHVFKHGT